MKTKYIRLTAIMFMCCINVFGQTANNISLNNTQSVVLMIEALKAATQEQISDLHKENQVLKEQLHKMESEIALYREDVRAETSRMNTNMADWLTILTIVIGVIAAVLGIAAPLYLNNRNDKLQKKKLDTLQEQINAAKADAASAKQSLVDVEKLKAEITSINQAIEASEKAAKKSANEAMASKLFAEALAEQDKDKAIELYSKVIQLDECNAGAYNNRGALKAQLGNCDGAIEDFNKAIELEPKDAGAYNNRGNSKMRLGDINGALYDYNRAAELDPKEKGIYQNRARLKQQLKDYNGAIADYNQAIELDPKNAELYNNRGNAKADVLNIEGAMADYNKAIELNPNIPEIYYNRGQLYYNLHLYDKSLIDYNRGIELSPNNSGAYNNRADLYLKMGQLDNALDDINTAITLDPSSYVSYVTRGEIYQAREQYNDAICDFSKVISINCNIKDIYKYLSECYYRLLDKTSDEEKKKQYVALADANQKKYNEFDNKADK